jgi:hydroxyethylthiazole kinase
MPKTLPMGIIADELARMRAATPLVHLLTNEVVQEITANVLLAAGASPAMIVAEEEAAAFAAISGALLVNVGTLYPARLTVMLQAVAAANQASVPWTLDPVAVGVLDYRTQACRDFLAAKPAAIRGNASEILALAGFAGSGRGVDSTAGSDTAQSAAEQLARTSGAIVAVTGETDFITDGELTWATPWGHPIMTRVVGTGCALSALVAAFTAQAPNRLNAVAAACAVAGLCGERAAASSRGPGSFKADFLDALYRLSPETLREHAE